MKWLQDAPIKRKLYLIIMVTVAAVLLLNLLASLTVQIGAARDASEARLQALAMVLGANSRAVVLFRDRDAAREVLDTLATQDDVLWAEVLLPNGDVFASYRSHRVTPAGEPDSTDIPSKPEFGQISVQLPILFDGESIGQFHIIGDLSQFRGSLAWQALVVLGVFTVSMLLALLLSRQLQRVVSIPVYRLLDAMGGVAATRDFGRRVEPINNDELGDLTNGFNNMLNQVQDYDRELESYRQGLEQLVVERTEELELAKQGAVAASRAKSEFLATMSHEIRTPMTGVIGFAKLLGQTTLDDQQRRYTEIIGSSAYNLLGIIDEILDFSKMEAGKIELECRDFDVEQLLAEVRTTLTPKALEKGIDLTVFCSRKVPLVLHGDSSRLRQILTNLADNAVKFTDQGTVAIHLEKVDQKDGSRAGIVALQILVRDTGTGITPEQQALLFQPFQQGDGSITRVFGGTGLGLVITQRLVRLMGGEIALSSVPGKGSDFTATVRLEQPKGAGLAHASAAVQPDAHTQVPELVSAEEVAPTFAGLRILVVDDNPINLTLASTLLVSCDVDVVGVTSAIEALEATLDRSFDLVLMDLEMPEMSGIEATQRMRASQSEASEVPIIAITAHAFTEKRGEIIAAGMNDLLAKPYLPEQLYAMIAKWCPTHHNPTRPH